MSSGDSEDGRQPAPATSPDGPMSLEPREGDAAGHLVFDPRSEILSRDGASIDLPPRSRSVLRVLVADAGRVVSRDRLLEDVWEGRPVADAVVADAVAELRRALDDDPRDPRFIQTVPKRGYRFIGGVTSADRPAGRDLIEFPRWVLLTAAAVVVLVAALCFALGRALRDPPPVSSAPLAATLSLDPPLRLDGRGGPAVALSPDGTRLAYVAMRDDGAGHLQLVSLTDGRSRTLPGTVGDPRSPFFSPDGRWIAFFASGRLWRASTGPSESLVEEIATAPRGFLPAGDWGADDTIVVSPGRGHGVLRVDASDGGVEPLTELRSGEEGHLWPMLLPGGRGVIFSSPTPGTDDFGPARIEHVALDGGDRRTLLEEGGALPRYLPPDRLLFVDAGEVRMARLGPDLEVVGEPTRWRSGAFAWRRASPHLAVSASGDVALVEGPTDLGPSTLYWLQLNTLNEWPLDLTVGRAYRGLEISPDGRHLASSIDGDLWAYEFRTDHFSRVAGTAALERDPAWRADSRTITFAANAGTDFDLFTVRRDRPGDLELLLDDPRDDFPSSWSPDDRLLAFTRMDPVTGADIYLLDGDDGSVEALVRDPADDRDARFSPDGRALAFVSDRDGADEIFLLMLGEDEPVRLTSQGGRRPRWDPGGSMLLLRRGGGYYNLPVRVGDSVRSGHVLRRWREGDPMFEFALTLDGAYKPLVARRHETGALREVLLLRGASSDPPAAVPPVSR